MTGRGDYPQQNGGFGRKRRQSEGEDKYHAKQAKEKANNAGEEPDVDEAARQLAGVFITYLCFMCQQREPRCSFPPCAHLVCCEQCVPDPALCPHCNMQIDLAKKETFKM